MKCYILFVSLFIFEAVSVESKPLDLALDIEDNEIDDERKPEKAAEQQEENLVTRLTRTKESSTTQRIEDVILKENEKSDVNPEGSDPGTKPQNNQFLNSLLPFLQRLRISPFTFLQDRVNQLQATLSNLGIINTNTNATSSKQFATTNGLLNLIGVNDSGFYTDRLEPAGFLGGNGWFANKGGILGGPGAIYSTGSILTDYPSAYKK